MAPFGYARIPPYVLLALVLALFVSPSAARAQEAADDGPPLSPDRPRPLSPDRPDATESPNSVDAGYFQLELDVFASERDEGEATLTFARSNLKLGVAPFLDLQLVLEPLVSTPPAVSDGPRGLGYGDPIVRVKIALFGNDGGRFAIGLLPWLRIPVPGSAGELDSAGSVDRAWEGGLAVPMGVELPWELSLGAMVEVDVIRNTALDGHHPELFATLTVSRTLVGPLAAFVELTLRAAFDDDVTLPATLNGGLLYEVHEDFVLDAGAYVGLTEDAADVVSFVGATARFGPE